MYIHFWGFHMSTVTLTKWGNSVGIRIPATIMKEAHLVLGEELEISANEQGVLTLIPVQKQQDGWLEMFNAIADSENDELLLDVSNEFDEYEWTW